MIRKRGNRVVSLPKKGRLIVVTDIHGNLADFNRFLNIWDKDDPDCHIVFTGDLIHELEYDRDYSVEILDKIFDLDMYSNFHVLLGNHELGQINEDELFKWGSNQVEDFKRHVEDRCEYMEQYWLELVSYIEMMKFFPYFCVTENGFFISHAGPTYDEYIMSPLDICPINSTLSSEDEDLYNYHMRFLNDMLWARPYDDYDEKRVNNFLKDINYKFMVVGHTPCEGQCFHILGNQIRFDSSFLTDDKYFLDIDLSKDYKDIIEVAKSIKTLDEVENVLREKE